MAEMLGVQRTSISPVAHTFQRAGIIQYARGKIEILDVEALRESACECYETATHPNLGRSKLVPQEGEASPRDC